MCVYTSNTQPRALYFQIIADPPYNIGVQGAQWDQLPQYMSWSKEWMSEAARVLKPGGGEY